MISECYQLKQAGMELREPISSGDRVAYYTIQAEDFEDYKKKSRRANELVKAIASTGEDLFRHDLIMQYV